MAERPRGTRVVSRRRPKTDAAVVAHADASGSRAGVPAARAASSDGPPRPPRGTGIKGLSLGIKFAALVAGLIAAVMLLWGWVVSRAARDRLEEQIVQKGVGTARALMLHGQTILEKQARGEPVTWTGLEDLAGGDILDAAIQAEGSPQAWKMSRTELVFVGGRENVPGYGDFTVTKRTTRADRGDRPAIEIVAPVRGAAGPLGKVRVWIDAKRVEEALSELWMRMVGAGLVFLVLGVGASFFLGMQVAKPAKMLMEDMELVATGDYEHVARATSGDEIGRLAHQFNYMTWAIRELRAKEKESERITSELDTAREIQANLLPPKIPQIPGFEIFPFYRSAKEVGGDYYDFFPIDRERLAMVVADVSGKGIPGSMVMASTRTILRILGPQCATAGELFRQTNRLVAKDIKRGMFVTAIFALLNVRAKEMTVCSAGHNPMVLYRERTAKVEVVNPNGIALGFDAGPIFDRTLQESTTRLEPGDAVVMYTDGVVEAMDPKGDEYGDDRFYAFVRDHARMRSRDLVQATIKDLDAHKGEADQHDDITIVTFRVLA
ncbi:MAG: PP2C family protein-serine/threonine phosphatase [Planctomycetota bacterium]